MYYKDIDIPSEEQGKYKMKITGGTHPGIAVRIYYNEDGSINEEETYNLDYLKKKEESRRRKEEPMPKEQPKPKPKAKPSEKKETPSDDSDEDKFLKVLLFPLKLIWWIVKLLFKAIWWIVKNTLKIVLSCLFLGWLADMMGLGDDK